jgi:hypothetical protein
MKKAISIFLMVMIANGLFAQKETYEFTSYTPPKDFTKEVKENTYTSYTSTNKQKKSYCRMIIMLSTTSKGGIKEDFESEWQELVVKSYNPTEGPQTSEMPEANGWIIKKGVGKFSFENKEGNVTLNTMSGFSRCVSIITITNSPDYSKNIDSFLTSIEMQKPDTLVAAKEEISPQAPAENTSLLGTWVATASDQSSFRVKNGVMNYIMRQYDFNANGTYTFTSRAYDPLMTNMILGRENGTYQINGNSVIVMPKKYVLQAWSKKNGTDDWGKLLNTQNQPLEKVTYQFSKHYFSGIREMSLMLQADKPTQRDGPFSGNNVLDRSWIFSPVSTSHQRIKLPE